MAPADLADIGQGLRHGRGGVAVHGGDELRAHAPDTGLDGLGLEHGAPFSTMQEFACDMCESAQQVRSGDGAGVARVMAFPIVATGLSTIEPELEDVMKALGASRWDILVKIGIPRPLPYLFASLKVAITLAYVGSAIAESDASRFGIGNLTTRAGAGFNVPLVFAALIALAIIGVIIYVATVEPERRTTGWAHRSGMGQG
jgi:hypothetical protein